MPQIANQDYNFIDFNVLPYYEGIERLYRAYLQGTALDCVFKIGGKVNKVTTYEETESEGKVALLFSRSNYYIIKAPLATDDRGYLIFNYDDFGYYIVSADGFKLKPVVKDGVLTGVEVTTEKVKNNVHAQYFKDWMIGQSVTPK